MKRPARQLKRKALSVKRQGVFLKTLVQFFFIVAVVVLFLGYLGSWGSAAYAASGINKQINFQGKLVDNNGLNVADSTYTVVFSLYTTSSGGSATWTESDSVTTKNGVFQVALGAVTAFPGNVDFNSDTWYLGINVNSNGEMTPRIRFTAVPYAFNAAALDGIVATNSASQFTLTGATSSPLTLTVNGSLTLGSTIQPTNAGSLTVESNGTNGLTLDTGGNATLSIGTANATSIVIGNHATSGSSITFDKGSSGTFTLESNGSALDCSGFTNAGKLTTNSSGNIICGNDTSGASTWTTFSNSSNTIIVPSSTTDGLSIGNAGTGNYLAYSGLYVEPAFNTKGNALVAINQTGLGDIFTASAGAGTKFVIQNGGNVGIGTTSPIGVEEIYGGAQGGNAALIVDQRGASTNDILAASSSGATKFIVHNDGSIQTAGANATADITTITGGNGLTIMPKANGSGAGGGFTLKAGNGSGAAGGGLVLDAGTGSSNGTISIGTTNASGITIATSSITTTAQGIFAIGTGGNTFTFNPASGPTYAGTARPVKQIVLSPEYAGASLTADGSVTTNGSMTSDNTLNAGGIGWKNYYQWTSTQGSLQDYTVAIRVTLPQDFDSWETGSCGGSTCALEIAYQTGVSGTTDNAVSVQVNNAESTPGTVICTISAVSSTSWTTTGCTSTTLATSPTWNSAGATAIIRIKVAADSTSSALARVGDITLRYYAKF